MLKLYLLFIFMCYNIQELNTAEEFISFYENMMPFVQTLSQVILHKETIMTELLDRLKIEAKLSLEPILRYVDFGAPFHLLESLKDIYEILDMEHLMLLCFTTWVNLNNNCMLNIC